jgi:hypothetical protein
MTCNVLSFYALLLSNVTVLQTVSDYTKPSGMNLLEGNRTMRRPLTTLSTASLLAATAALLSPALTFAARALQPAEQLAAGYQATYDAAYKASDSALEPVVRSRRAEQQAADSVADVKRRKLEQPGRSPAADEAAVKAATAILHSARPGWQTSYIKWAYNDAWNAAYNALSREKPEGSDPAMQKAAQGLPSNLQPIALRGAKIRADRDAATVAAARAVACAVSQRIAADESASNAADDRGAIDRNATEK